MAEGRCNHTATLLPDGRVLIAGGFGETTFGSEEALDSIEVFDPRDGSFSSAGTMAAARAAHTATLLPTGDVLLLGGVTDHWASDVDSAERFDPVSLETRVLVPGLGGPRRSHTATVLPNGLVYLRGSGAMPELCDPSTDSFNIAGTSHYCESCSGTLLPSGNVLVAGGIGNSLADVLDTATVDHPLSGSFTFAGLLSTPRSVFSAVLLPDETVLIAAGRTSDNTYPPTAEL